MGRKILIIEDDSHVADYVARGLREHGHTVDLASDGREGLFLASEGTYDVLIVDRMLPAMDGLAVLKALRVAGIATPALILSAVGAVDDRIEGLEAGADDYLVKPFAFSELHARIGALLRRAERTARPARRSANRKARREAQGNSSIFRTTIDLRRNGKAAHDAPGHERRAARQCAAAWHNIASCRPRATWRWSGRSSVDAGDQSGSRGGIAPGRMIVQPARACPARAAVARLAP